MRSPRCCNLRRQGAACLAAHGATACTDVTGFGLLGHLLEMLRASSMDATLDPDAIPALEGARALLAKGITSSLHSDNVAALAALDEAAQTHPLAPLLIDPQTAGGLLAGVPADRARDCLDELRQLGYRAALIGRIERSAGPCASGTFRNRRGGGRDARTGHRLMSAAPREGRAALPAVDKILRSESCAALIEQHGRPLVLEAVRAALATRRETGEFGTVEEILDRMRRGADPADAAVAAPRLQPDGHRPAH